MIGGHRKNASEAVKSFCKTKIKPLIFMILAKASLSTNNVFVIPLFLYKSLPYNTLLNVMLRHLEWFEAADLIVKGMEGAIAAKTVTYDFERLMDGAKLLKCSEFGDAIIANM